MTAKNRIAAGLGTALLLAACAPVSPDTDQPAAERLRDDLGEQHHPIATSSPLAQRYFDQGLRLVYAFNHEAAIRSFQEGARLDPACAMCFWGIALAHGPNINAAAGPEGVRAAAEAARTAQRLATGASPAEQAYVAAVATRYSDDPAADRAALDRAYADAMRELHRAYPDDLDAATLFGESLMDLSPWIYWNPDGSPREHTEEFVSTFESVLARDPNHMGANHYYIHAVESHHPERAVPAADRLAALAPGAGHLVHMPTHIYWRVGRYQEAVELNDRAARVDEAFLAWCGSRGPSLYRALYYPHNVHFLWSAAAMEGQSGLALTTARRLVGLLSEETLDAYPLAEEFVPIPIVTLARFGRWDAVLGEPAPAPKRRYATGVWHYARGFARVRTGDLAGAEAELATVQSILGEEALGSLEFAVAKADAYLAVGERHLAGEIAAARGDVAAAVAALEESVRLQDALRYTEPPPWYLPQRQALGAVLLAAGRAAEADAVYRADLARLPANGWSLLGLSQSLRAEGKQTEAAMAEEGFRHAWARADVTLPASRF